MSEAPQGPKLAQATGWGLKKKGKLIVETVGPSRRSVMVNWLVIGKGIAVYSYHTDEQIEKMYWQTKTPNDEDIVMVHMIEHPTVKPEGTTEQ